MSISLLRVVRPQKEVKNIITKHQAWLVDKTLNLEYYIYTIMSWVIFGDSVTVASGGWFYDLPSTTNKEKN